MWQALQSKFDFLKFTASSSRVFLTLTIQNSKIKIPPVSSPKNLFRVPPPLPQRRTAESQIRALVTFFEALRIEIGSKIDGSCGVLQMMG